MTLGDRAFAALQYLLPKHALSRGAHALMRSRIGWLKNLLIRGFLLFYRVDLDEAVESDPLAHPTFNAFFTRALKPDARSVTRDSLALVSPVDGAVSQCGEIVDGRIVQAKGRTYSAVELLGGETAPAQRYAGGSFACLYLAPHNYHRIHMAADGRLVRTVYVPGALFSVNGSTARAVPDLFARNERVVCEFDTDAGRLAIVMIGALFVGSIETVWAGEINPPPRRQRAPVVLAAGLGTQFVRGQEIGRFNMGSTVVLLAEPGRVRWHDALRAEATVRYGRPIATIAPLQ